MTDTCKIDECPKPSRARGYCNAHYLKLQKYGDPLISYSLQGAGVEARFWDKVDKSQHPEGCWIWTAKLTDQGYGEFWYSKEKQHYRAHRLAYELTHGEIPGDLPLDHLCHNGKGCDLNAKCPHRACVNPEHLEAVEHKTNVLRGESPMAHNVHKTHCPQGHEYTEENTYLKGTSRSCKECHRISVRLAHREAAGIEGLAHDERYVKTHCKHGHEFNDENSELYTSPQGVSQRVCLVCRKARNKALAEARGAVYRPAAEPITHCKNGHEYTEENTYRQKGTSRRSCLTCRRANSARANERKRLARESGQTIS